eukprot:5700431-Prymnesium_polylepis.1
MLVCRLADDLLQRLPHCTNTVRQAAELPLLCRYFSLISATRRQPSSSPMFCVIGRRAEVDPVETPLDRRLASRRFDGLSESPDLLRSFLVNCFAEVVV